MSGREDEPLTERVQRARAREARARREPETSLWRTLGQVGALGWLIALPSALGAILGHLLDRRLGTGVTWALGLLLLGVAAGLYALWRAMTAVRAHEEELLADAAEGPDADGDATASATDPAAPAAPRGDA